MDNGQLTTEAENKAAKDPVAMLEVFIEGPPCTVRDAGPLAYFTCAFPGVWQARHTTFRDAVWAVNICELSSGRKQKLDQNATVQPVRFSLWAIEVGLRTIAKGLLETTDD